MAKAWMEYVKDTKVSDTTSPPVPTNLRLQGNTLTWEAEADLESGLASFIIERDGQVLATVPERGKNPFGRPVFQKLQYSDTPTPPLVPMQFTDTQADRARDDPAQGRVSRDRIGRRAQPRLVSVRTAFGSAPGPCATGCP